MSLLKESASAAGAPGLAAEECGTLASGNFGAQRSPQPHAAAVASSPGVTDGESPSGCRLMKAKTKQQVMASGSF